MLKVRRLIRTMITEIKIVSRGAARNVNVSEILYVHDPNRNDVTVIAHPPLHRPIAAMQSI